MKKILYAVIISSYALFAMEQNTPRYIQHVPLEIWNEIFSYLIIKQSSQTNYQDIKKMKLVSKFFYSLCDSNAIHTLISPHYAISTLILNTKRKREQFDRYFFHADHDNLFWIFQKAAHHGVIPIVRKTLERGVDPNEWYQSGVNCKAPALCIAAFTNNVAMAEELLNHSLTNPNATTEFDETPLILAAKKNYTEIVRALLKHPMIDPEKTNRDNQTAITIALNNHQEMAANILLS